MNNQNIIEAIDRITERTIERNKNYQEKHSQVEEYYSEKAKAISELIYNSDFDCQTENVVKLISLIIDEKIPIKCEKRNKVNDDVFGCLIVSDKNNFYYVEEQYKSDIRYLTYTLSPHRKGKMYFERHTFSRLATTQEIIDFFSLVKTLLSHPIAHQNALDYLIVSNCTYSMYNSLNLSTFIQPINKEELEDEFDENDI